MPCLPFAPAPQPSPAGGEGKIQEATALDPRSESGRTKGGGERFSRGFAPQAAVLPPSRDGIAAKAGLREGVVH